MLAHACKYFQMLANEKKWQKMTKNGLKVLANGKCLQMLANACKWQKNDKKWQQMTKNGLKMPVNGVLPISIYVSRVIVDPQHRKWKKIIIFWAFTGRNTECGHFSPFLACFWPVATLVSVSGPLMSVFVLVMTGWSELNKKILSECADFGNFNPFLAGFWPVIALVSVSKALNENISPQYDWIEFEQQKKIE